LGKRSGQGRLVRADGRVFEGRFENDKLIEKK
jgi:hypothetical protein